MVGCPTCTRLLLAYYASAAQIRPAADEIITTPDGPQPTPGWIRGAAQMAHQDIENNPARAEAHKALQAHRETCADWRLGHGLS